MRGKVNEMALRYGFFKDHPRLCGEKSAEQPALMQLRGSPPPMRGKEEFLLYYTKSDGITPAYAGKRQ